MIAINLLQPGQNTPLQTWRFNTDKTIRIGRAEDNDVILYSAVVSRYHVEIHWKEWGWELVNLGVNGTYFNHEEIISLPVKDGMIFRLASSGPALQIYLNCQPPATEVIKDNIITANHLT